METQSVESLEAVIGRLEKHRADLDQRGQQLSATRASLAYAALADNDDKSRARLDKLNLEAATHSSEVAAVQAAIKTANERLAAARQCEAMAVQAEHAQAIRHEWPEAAKDLADIDAGLSFAVGAAGRFYERCERMKLHGLKVPPQQTLMLADVVVSALMAMPKPLWQQFNHQGLEHVPPGRRRNAASLGDAWGPQVERQAAAIGGEPQQQPSNAPEAA
jgi:hypothetical protein